jgi:glycerate kinase
MRVVVCPDKFAGTLSAVEAADAIRTGWLRGRPGDDVRCLPLSDGGPGFVEVLHANLGGVLHDVQVRDPLGRPVAAQWLEAGGVAYVEAAQANGLALLAGEERDPWRTSSAGVGDLIADAWPLPTVVGMGGSGTSDGGRGAVERLEARTVHSLTLATDVDCPLLGPTGATYGFARQKGAREQDLPALEQRMAQWAQQAPELAEEPGAGAAGGLGFGLMLLGGRRVSGIEVVAQAVGLAQACAAADLAITGEGAFDWQSLHGKVVSGVVAAARNVLVLAGRVDSDALPAYALADFAPDRAFSDPAAALADLACDVAMSQYSDRPNQR